MVENQGLVIAMSYLIRAIAKHAEIQVGIHERTEILSLYNDVQDIEKIADQCRDLAE